MKIDAVLFDKDGTLMDFDAFWVPVATKAVHYVSAQFHNEDIPAEEFLAAFGIHDGETDPDGILCKGTYAQLGQSVYDVMKGHGCNIVLDGIVEIVERAFNSNINAGEIKPTTPNLAQVLAELKNRHKKLAVVTTDNRFITQKCLQELGVENIFDAIYTADGVFPAKPDPTAAFDFCKAFDINKENTVMVGDTKTDLDFAKNAGINMIGFAKNDLGKRLFKATSYTVISDLSVLLDLT